MGASNVQEDLDCVKQNEEKCTETVSQNHVADWKIQDLKPPGSTRMSHFTPWPGGLLQDTLGLTWEKCIQFDIKNWGMKK